MKNESNKANWVITTNDADFERDVLERSEQLPVVVDFWAEWCGPCRLLGPILEQLATEFAGQFVLVKAETDQAPVAAANFRVQSIPAVYAVRQRRVVDGFLGAMPLEQVREWLDRVLPSEAERLLEQAQGVGDPTAARELLEQAVAADPDCAPALIALGELALQQQDAARAEQLLAQLQARGFLEPAAERLRAALELHHAGAAAGSVADCRAALAADPANVQLQLQLADSLAAHHEYSAALSLCLSIVQQQAGDHRERARQIMVDIFRLLPDESPLTGEFRRKLSMALY